MILTFTRAGNSVDVFPTGYRKILCTSYRLSLQSDVCMLYQFPRFRTYRSVITVMDTPFEFSQLCQDRDDRIRVNLRNRRQRHWSHPSLELGHPAWDRSVLRIRIRTREIFHARTIL